jgi:propionate CoA-transferase
MTATDPRRLLDALHTFERGKVVSAREAVALIRDGDTIATGGFVGIGFAENIAVALEERYLEAAREDPHAMGSPRDLTLVYAAGQGDGKSRGLNHPRPQRAGQARDRRTLGAGAHAAGARRQPTRSRPTTFPRASSRTFSATSRRASPGCYRGSVWARSSTRASAAARSTECTTEDIVSLMQIDDEEYLFYRTFPINVGVFRGTTADPDGNITMEREALTLEALAIAMAAHNSGGIVIAQVERIAERHSLNPRQVKVPWHPRRLRRRRREAEYHQQTFAEPYSAAFAGEIRVPASAVTAMPMSERKVIAAAPRWNSNPTAS